MNKTKVKAIAGVLVVFLLGAVIGSLSTGLLIRRGIRRFVEGGPQLQRFFMRRLTREINLTDEQKPEVQKVLEQTEVEVRQFLQSSRVEFSKIMQRRNAVLKEILTPEQQKKLDKLFERMHRPWMPPGSEPFKEHRYPSKNQ